MAPPDPAPHSIGRCEPGQINRLWIVNEDDVSLQIQSLSVLAIDLEVKVQVAWLERDRLTLQPVVKGLRHSIELRRPTDHLPVGIDAELLHHRDHPSEN